MGKVYNRVLTERLTQFAEREGGGIVEEQGGVSPRKRNRGSVVCTYRDSKREREPENNIHSIYRCEESI